MLEVIVALALVVPFLLAVGIGWLFIRQAKPTAGILSGLGLIVVLLTTSIALINKDIADCVAQCAQAQPGLCGLCGEWSGVVILALVVIALIDAVGFLFVGLTIARRYHVPFVWPNTLLVAIALIAIIISVINYFAIKPYFDALPVSENAMKYYASFAGIALGLLLIVFAVARARKQSGKNAVDSS